MNKVKTIRKMSPSEYEGNWQYSIAVKDNHNYFIDGILSKNSIIIVDEAQNVSINNMRSTMTRIGTDTKMIITGDTKQIDMKKPKLSSLDLVVKLFTNKPDIGTMVFDRADIVRDPIVMVIEETFDEWEEKNLKG